MLGWSPGRDAGSGEEGNGFSWLSKEMASWFWVLSAPCRPCWVDCSAFQLHQGMVAPVVCGSGCRELLPYFWTLAGALSKQRAALLLSTRISFPPAISLVYFTHGYCSRTWPYMVKHKQRPYVMSIVVTYKSVAVCLGAQGSPNRLLFTVWSLSVQWTAPLFSTIVPHSLKHLSPECLQRQTHCRREGKPANWESEDDRQGPRFERSRSHSGRLLWKEGCSPRVPRKSQRYPLSLG